MDLIRLKMQYCAAMVIYTSSYCFISTVMARHNFAYECSFFCILSTNLCFLLGTCISLFEVL